MAGYEESRDLPGGRGSAPPRSDVECVPDPEAVARGDARRAEVQARRAVSEAETANRVAYRPGVGDRENIRRSGRA